MTGPQACRSLGRDGYYDKLLGTWNGASLPPTGPGPLGNEAAAQQQVGNGVGTWKRPDGAQSPGAASITEDDQTDDEVSFTIPRAEPAAKKDVESMIKTKAISVTAKCTLTIASGAWIISVRKFR